MFKVLYLNLASRPDRDKFQREQLERLGIPYERVEATLFDTAGGFQNRAFRGSFYDHLQQIKRIAAEQVPYVILEDDTVISNEFYDPVWRMEEALLQVHRLDSNWCFLHFYKETAVQNQKMLMQRMNSLAMNAYTVNVRRAGEVAAVLSFGYDKLLRGPKNLWQSAIDQHCRLHVWPKYPCYGIDNTALQGNFGSDTGWREHRVDP